MKNRIITLSLVASLMVSSINAETLLLDQTSTTSASSWKDPATGITYQNFGSVNFKFKKNVTSFAPWAKFRAPSVKAGCGGISLDAGFAAFLDLETIGKQLEQATASVGMGVIVVLLQTMPSIGKAFENIQKLIRKLQSMLANTCQTTVSFLNNNKYTKDVVDSMESQISLDKGAGYFNDMLGGAVEKMEAIEDVAKCGGTDTNCIKSSTRDALGLATSEERAKVTGPKAAIGVENTITQAVIKHYSLTSIYGVKHSSLRTVLRDNKFDGYSLNISAENRLNIGLRMAIFGVLAVPFEDGTINIKGLTNGVGPFVADSANALADFSKAMVTTKTAPTFSLTYNKPVNDIDAVSKFLLGDDLTGTATNSLLVPAAFTYKLIVSSTDATENDATKGDLITNMLLERNENYNMLDTYSITWGGIKTSSYETILHAIDPITYSAPTTPIGVYMPKGSTYVSMIKQYAEEKDYPKYADLLAKINVKYAIQNLILEAKNDTIKNLNYEKTQANIAAVEQYLASVDDIASQVLERVEDYSGDVIYLNNLDQLFESMKQTSLQKRLNRTIGK